jgi:hypothetical protein
MQFMMRSEKPTEALGKLRAFLVAHADKDAAERLCAELGHLVELNERRRN